MDPAAENYYGYADFDGHVESGTALLEARS